MLSLPSLFLIVILVVLILLVCDYKFSAKQYFIGSFFINLHLKKVEDFKFATIEQYMGGSYRVSYHIGDSIYTATDEEFTSMSGANIQRVIDDIYWKSGMKKGSLHYEVLHPDTVIIKRVEDFHADK